jgi:hypothetical protein
MRWSAGRRAYPFLPFGFPRADHGELVALDVADLEECPEGLRVTIRRSKTDRRALAPSSRSAAARSPVRSRR